MSNLHFIGGEKGGVGKSVVARLIAQRCIDRHTPFAAFDADASHGALARHYGDFTKSVDLTSFESADEIVNAATGAVSLVVVDLPAQIERFMAEWIDAADILGFSEDCGVRVYFWHVIDDGKDSMTTLERLVERYGDRARVVVVKNKGRGKNFSYFEGSTVRRTLEDKGGLVLELPALHAPVMQKIDQHDASFWAAAYNHDYATDVFSRLDRRRVKVWFEGAQAQFDALGDAL